MQLELVRAPGYAGNICRTESPRCHPIRRGLVDLSKYVEVVIVGEGVFRGMRVWRIRASGIIDFPIDVRYSSRATNGAYVKAMVNTAFLVSQGNSTLLHVSSHAKGEGHNLGRNLQVAVQENQWMRFSNYGEPLNIHLPAACTQAK